MSFRYYLPRQVLQTQTSSHISPDPLLEILPPLPPHPRRIHIRRALIIRFRNHAHHTDQDFFDTLYRTPPLRSLLVVVRIIARRVQDRDTDDTVGVDYTTPATSVMVHRAHINQGEVPFGCQTSHRNFIEGGISG